MSALVWLGCGDDGGTSATATGSGASSSSGNGAGGAGAGPVPMGAELLTWLQDGGYLEWPAESAVHDSTGPHFGDVRTYVNDVLAASITSGNDTHPIDAAAVKELYGSGTEVAGWSVSAKLAADSAGGDNWYWFEYYNGSTLLDAQGSPSCTGCHESGVDFFRSPIPLQ